MNAHTKCRTTTSHFNRNGTFLRVLIAVSAESAGTIDVHRICDDLALGTSRIIVVAAPTLGDLDRHTERLTQSARLQHWELIAADGMHRRFIETMSSADRKAAS
jgi:hypothetical protein